MDIPANESLPFYFATWGGLLQFHVHANQHTKESEQEKHHILNCNRFNVNKDGKRLSWSKKTEAILQSPLKIASSIQVKVSVIHCAEVSIDPYNLCRPIVVTAFNYISETGFNLHVYFPESDSFTQLCNFCWKETLCLDDIYVKLLDGPSIVLHFQKSLLIGLWDPQSKGFVTKQFSVTFTSPHSIKHSRKASNRQLLLLAVSSVDSHDTSVQDDSMTDLFEDSSAEVTGSDWLLLRASIEEIEAVNFFSLPHAYADVTVKILVPETNRNGNFRGGVILATRLAQLVFIKEDNHSRLCDLPFADVTILSAVTVGDNEKVILVGSERKGVCLVDFKTFKVQKHWLSSISVFCEDFLNLGWNQILLISEHLSVDEEKQNSFILTDLIHTWSSAEGDGNETADDGEGDACHKYLLNALQAVEIKLQNTSTLLQNLQLQSSRKNSVIQQSRTALQAISEQTGILPKREASLMCIISPNDQEELPKNLALEQTLYSISVKTNSFWQRIVGGKWIIGVKVENNGTRPVSDICVLLVYTNQSGRNQTCTSHVLYPSEALSLKTDVRTEGSLSLEQGQETWVTSVLQCPLFDDTPNIIYDIALIWKEWIQNDHKVQQSVEKRRCVHKSSLSFKDLNALTINATLDGIFAGKITKVDFLALDAIQECNRLIISSQHTALQGLPHLLCSEMGFAPVKMNEVDGLFCDKGQLAGMRIFNKSVNATSMKMDVYSWDKNQLIIFCHTLYNILPYDACVKAVDSGSSARVEARSHLIAHLQSELDMIKETMTSDSQQEASKPACSVSKELRLKDFVNLRENTDEAMRKFSSISGT
ncbi:Fanconi anemia group B protein-like [Holothuria leucospilota]|uniref:Fanconi anemia group B protein-like n=1 Tax=Holothuria leucospilota TaxID=206669 RepID=A0A9Q1BK39_HOLLE|nr:Fanconi anemia group B protein-like [Holothuria leucospilota]